MTSYPPKGKHIQGKKNKTHGRTLGTTSAEYQVQITSTRGEPLQGLTQRYPPSA